MKKKEGGREGRGGKKGRAMGRKGEGASNMI